MGLRIKKKVRVAVATLYGFVYWEKVMADKNEHGLWKNKQGKFVHPDLIPADKKLEDELVERLINEAEETQAVMSQVKKKAYDECYGLVDLLLQEYKMDRLSGSDIGSVTFKNFDGSKEVQIQIAKQFTFDAKLSLAKEKVNEFLLEITENAGAEIKTLILRAFEVNDGKVDAKQIMSLKNYDITHPKWLEAMQIIDDAIEVVGTKSYIRFKKADGVEKKMKTIVLDFASVPLPTGGAA